MITSILTNWLTRGRKKHHNNNKTNNDNDDDSNNGGAILTKPVALAAMTLLGCIIPMLFATTTSPVLGIEAIVVDDGSALDASQTAVGGATGQEQQEQDLEEEERLLTGEAQITPVQDNEVVATAAAEGEAGEEPQGDVTEVGEDDVELETPTGGSDGIITSATPETGIVTQPAANAQAVQESVTGTPVEPEVVNPGLNPRATLPQSVPMQEYQDFQAVLAQNGYNFNDHGVVYSQAYTDGRTIMIVMGTEGNTDQPPAMILQELATAWGFQLLTYAYNPEGQLVTVFLEAF